MQTTTGPFATGPFAIGTVWIANYGRIPKRLRITSSNDGELYMVNVRTGDTERHFASSLPVNHHREVWC